MKNLFFVTGFARSGTTLLATLLGRNADVCATPETCFFEHIYRRKGQPTLSSIENSRFYQDLNLSISSNLDFSSYRNLFVSGLKAFNQNNKKIIIEKSPHHLAFLPSIFHEFPNTKVIVIIRDPRDIFCSLRDVEWAHSSPLRHAAEWSARHSQLIKLESVYPDNIFITKYEDLIQEPHNELTRICKYLGLSFQQQMLESTSTTTVPEWEKSWKDKVKKPIDRTRIGRYREVLDERDVAIINSIAKEAIHFKYTIEIGKTSPITQFAALMLKSNAYRNLRLFIRRRRFYDNI